MWKFEHRISGRGPRQSRIDEYSESEAGQKEEDEEERWFTQAYHSFEIQGGP